MAKILYINEIEFKRKVFKALEGEKYVKFAYNAAAARYNAAKRNLLKEFDNHIVTAELQQSPNEEGSQIVGHGNLVSFIGFYDGEDPAGELRRYLDNEIDIGKNPKIETNSRKFTYSFPIKVPDIREVYKEFPTPDDWSTKSWIDMIENGVNNVIYYIFTRSDAFKAFSRSGHGRQDSKPVSKKDNSFKPMKYISEILKNFKDRF